MMPRAIVRIDFPLNRIKRVSKLSVFTDFICVFATDVILVILLTPENSKMIKTATNIQTTRQNKNNNENYNENKHTMLDLAL